MISRSVTFLLAGCVILGLSAHARGVIISTPTGAENTTAPSDFPYWDYVSRCRNGTAVYLGNRWALTASHVGPSSVTFAGQPFTAVSGSTIQLKNSDNSLADLVLFRINANPGLAPLPLVTKSPSVNNSVTMVGAGYSRSPGITYWDSSWNQTTGAGDYSGYYWDTSARTLRWGTNQVSWVNQTVNVGYGPVVSFATRFDSGGSLNEAQAASGDSGGPVFVRTVAGYVLGGMMFAMGPTSGQPASTAVYGNVTYSADLYTYMSQLTPLDGDANVDGKVDQADYAAWFNHYGETNATLADGDFNGDNIVDQADYALWFNNYGNTVAVTTATSSLAGTSAPEPASLVVLLASALFALKRGGKKTYKLRRPRA